MYTIYNKLDRLIFKGNEAEFIHFIREIAVMEDNEDLSITCISEAKDYIDNYCDNYYYHSMVENNVLDLNYNQHLMSIRQNGQTAHIEAKDGKIVTEGFIGNNEYNNFIELIKGLQGFDIKIDEFYW